MRARLRIDNSINGVVVTAVQPGSSAAPYLQTGDIIAEVNRDKVGTQAEFEKQTKNLKSGDDLVLLVHRQGRWLYLVIRL